MIHITLYGTAGCHLCEEAETVIFEACRVSKARIHLERVDIAGDSELENRYGLRIPVLVEQLTDTEISWPFDAPSLASFFSRANPFQWA